MSVCIRLTNLDATAALARSVAAVLSPGDVLLLCGDLGAGKTTFTKALAECLLVEEQVTSPTFAIMQHYAARLALGPVTLLHLDAYRLGGPEAVDDLGVLELLDEGAIAVVEWGDLVAAAFPEAWRLTLRVDSGEERVVTVDAPPHVLEHLAGSGLVVPC